jgi:hypothetical protein
MKKRRRKWCTLPIGVVEEIREVETAPWSEDASGINAGLEMTACRNIVQSSRDISIA